MPIQNTVNLEVFHPFTRSFRSDVGIVFQSAYDLVLEPYRN